MWKSVLTAVLAVCVWAPAALAQSNQYPQVRNESNVSWKFGAVCGNSSVSVVLAPNHSASIDPNFAQAQQGCGLYGGSIKPTGDFNSANMPGPFGPTSVCGVNRAGQVYCAQAVVSLTVQIARADKPVAVWIDGTPLTPGALSSGGMNKQLLAGQHTVLIIGTGRGSFDISALWQLPTGAMTTLPLLKGPSPNVLAGETWVVSKTLQLDPVIR